MSKEESQEIEIGKAINLILQEVAKLKKDNDEVRVHLNSLTKEVNEQGSAISTAKTAQSKTSGAAQTFADYFGKAIDFVMNNPELIFGSAEKKESFPGVKKLQEKYLKSTLENQIKIGELTVEKLQKEVERAGKTGWDIL